MSAKTHYNIFGNIVTSQHMIAGYPRTLNFSYEWYLNGGLKSVTYPSKRKIEYAADDAGRNTKVSMSTGLKKCKKTGYRPENHPNIINHPAIFTFFHFSLWINVPHHLAVC